MSNQFVESMPTDAQALNSFVTFCACLLFKRNSHFEQNCRNFCHNLKLISEFRTTNDSRWWFMHCWGLLLYVRQHVGIYRQFTLNSNIANIFFFFCGFESYIFGGSSVQTAFQCSTVHTRVWRRWKMMRIARRNFLYVRWQWATLKSSLLHFNSSHQATKSYSNSLK